MTSATSLVSIGDVLASPKGRRIVPSFAIDRRPIGREEVLEEDRRADVDHG